MLARRRAFVLAALAAAALVMVGSPAQAIPVAVTQQIVVGYSVQGRPIIAYHRYTLGSYDRKPFLVIGQMHGDEETGKRVITALRARSLPASANLWLIPTMNPDGDAKNTRTNARGTDLNRNFPVGWVKAGGGTRYYSGPKAQSEPETRALHDFLLDLQPWRVVSIHNPLYGVDKSGAKDPALARNLASWSGYPLRSFTCNSSCHGTMTQFINASTSGAAVTFEFGSTTSTAQINRVTEAVVRLATS